MWIWTNQTDVIDWGHGMRNPRKGVLLRDVPVRLVDVSLSGCLLSTTHPIPSGAVGNLVVRMGTKQYQDTVHVVRTTQHQGVSHNVTLGSQFAWATRPGAASLRGEVPSIVPHADSVS